MLTIILVALWGATPVLAIPGGYNATVDEGNIVCVYPLSGQYGLLPRILYYALLVFSVAAHKHVWLIAGALASALTYSGTAAIHAVALVATTNANPEVQFDIDIVGVWAILSAAWIAYDPVVEWSSTLRESQFRPIFHVWGGLVLIGSCCAAGALYHDYPSEPLCSGDACYQACLATSQILRAPSEMVTVADEAVFGTMSLLLWPAIVSTITFGFLSGLYGACIYSGRRRTRAELNKSITSNRRWRDQGTPKMRRQARAEIRVAKYELRTGKYPLRRTWCSYISVVAAPIIVILNEVYLLARPGLPSNEQPYAIGQWGPWVSVCLALIAAAVNTWYEPRWRARQDVLKEEQGELGPLDSMAPVATADTKSAAEAPADPKGTESIVQEVNEPGLTTSQSVNLQTPPISYLKPTERLKRYEIDFETSTWRPRADTDGNADLEIGFGQA